jgi:Kdo2-lipid IVA lauroyltransferase/acyltransferase
MNLSSFLQLKVNIFLYRRLGWKLAFIYIMVLGNGYFFFKRKEKRKIKEAISMIFVDSKRLSENKVIVRKVFRGIMLHYYEKIFNVYSHVEGLKNFLDRYIRSEGITAIEEGIAQGGGVLLVTGHFGGIEYIPTYLAARKYPITILAKFSSDHLRKISKDLAQKMVFRIIDAGNCPNIVKAIINDLRENRIVITQCDEIEQWRPSRDEKVSFLGKQTGLDKTINILQKRVKTTVVFAVMHRSDRRSYEFVAHSMDEILNADLKLSNASIGKIVLKLLEQYIYNFPEEWYQWKKFLEIRTLEGKSDKPGETRSPAFLQPVFGKIS